MPPKYTRKRDDKELSPTVNRIVFGIFLLVILMGIFWIVGNAWANEYRKLAEIHAHGQRAEARVINVHQEKSYNRQTTNCNEVADYEFKPNFDGEMVRNHIYLGTCQESNTALYYAAYHHSIPIAYNVSDPTQAELNIDDYIFRRDPGKILLDRFRFNENILFEMFVIFFLILISIILVIRRNRNNT